MCVMYQRVRLPRQEALPTFTEGANPAKFHVNTRACVIVSGAFLGLTSNGHLRLLAALPRTCASGVDRAPRKPPSRARDRPRTKEAEEVEPRKKGTAYGKRTKRKALEINAGDPRESASRNEPA